MPKAQKIPVDFFGTELKVGDVVAYTRAGSKFHKLGEITGFDKGWVRIKNLDGTYGDTSTQVKQVIKRPDPA